MDQQPTSVNPFSAFNNQTYSQFMVSSNILSRSLPLLANLRTSWNDNSYTVNTFFGLVRTVFDVKFNPTTNTRRIILNTNQSSYLGKLISNIAYDQKFTFGLNNQYLTVHETPYFLVNGNLVAGSPYELMFTKA
jgi:hypothetical protein